MALNKRGFRPQGYIDIKALAAKLGLSTQSVYALIKDSDDFPKRRMFGAQTTLWHEGEIDAWIQACIDAADRNAGEVPPAKAAKLSKAVAASKAAAAAARAKTAPEPDAFAMFVDGFCAEMRADRAARVA